MKTMTETDLHKILVRLPVDQHEELKGKAKARRISVNSAVLFAIEDWLVKETLDDELALRRARRQTATGGAA